MMKCRVRLEQQTARFIKLIHIINDKTRRVYVSDTQKCTRVINRESPTHPEFTM
jgi:hypothetical protein